MAATALPEPLQQQQRGEENGCGNSPSPGVRSPGGRPTDVRKGGGHNGVGCSNRGGEGGTLGIERDSGEEKADTPYLHARRKLENLLNKSMRIRMTDGRTLVGCFLCTDRDCNVILGSAQEYLKPTDSFSAGEPRVLGLAMVPGHHIVSIEVELESLASLQYL
ncbi:N-alpha-acetyltransferase 38, NatC auxiliary subunit isoform X1 [Podarcis muralis]